MPGCCVVRPPPPPVQVICLDNFFTGSKDNIAHLLDKENFELIRHDVSAGGPPDAGAGSRHAPPLLLPLHAAWARGHSHIAPNCPSSVYPDVLRWWSPSCWRLIRSSTWPAPPPPCTTSETLSAPAAAIWSWGVQSWQVGRLRARPARKGRPDGRLGAPSGRFLVSRTEQCDRQAVFPAHCLAWVCWMVSATCAPAGPPPPPPSQQVQPHQDHQDVVHRHHEHAGPGQALPRPLPHLLHLRGLRRPAAAPADRRVLG